MAVVSFTEKDRRRAFTRYFDIFDEPVCQSAGGYIGPDAVIKGNLSLPHGLHGIFISRYAEIGENCLIYQNVTIGEVNRKAPVIGDNCLIGAGAVVSTDIPDGCTVVSQPVRIIRESRLSAEERHGYKNEEHGI